jgi:hypothetical protein
LHAKGEQPRGAGGTQVPAAVHVEGPVYEFRSQPWAAQKVPTRYLRQAPAPSHLPSVPQDSGPWSAHVPWGSAAPGPTFVHFPIDEGSAQLWQGPVQEVPQQTPSTQKVLAHSAPVAHGWPSSLGPQLPFTQAWPA